MNSYTVPLNHEEQRHACYQGRFKWFINDLADKLEGVFLGAGIFKEKQLVRMGDNKLLTELCDSFLHGIRTTNRAILDSVYKTRDARFDESEDFYRRLTSAFNLVRQMEVIHDTTLMKPHMVYSLAQAITHVRRPVRKLRKLFKSPGVKSIDLQLALPNLTALAQAVDSGEDSNGRFVEFVDASNEKTNVRENREIRFKWLCKALCSEQI